MPEFATHTSPETKGSSDEGYQLVRMLGSDEAIDQYLESLKEQYEADTELVAYDQKQLQP